MRVELLRDLLRAGGLKLDFVFVSACHSRRTGEAFIDAGVPHVVCVKVDAMVSCNTTITFSFLKYFLIHYLVYIFIDSRFGCKRFHACILLGINRWQKRAEFL